MEESMKQISFCRGAAKRWMGICLLLLALSLLTGCGNESVFDGSKTTDETGFYMEYAVLNQEEAADLTLSKGEKLQVTFAHTKGNVDVTVGQNGKEPIYRGTKQDNAEFILTIPEAGVYHISVVGHQANGQVSFARIPAGEQ